LFLNPFVLDVAEDVRHNSKGQHFSQNPRRRILVRVCSEEVRYKILARVTEFRINKRHSLSELGLISEVGSRRNPEWVGSHFTANVDYRTSDSYLNLFYLIENE
jgi:hypothetical protein